MSLRMKAWGLAVTLCCALLLSACGGGGGGGGGSEQSQSGADECVWGQSDWNDCDWAG